MSYVVLKVYSFACDMQGCEEETEFIPLGLPRLVHAERELRRMGWRVNAGMHICPNHGEDSERQGGEGGTDARH